MNRTAKQANLNKVIQMASLQRCVLPIVREAEQFSGIRLYGCLAMQSCDGCRRQHGGGCASTLRSERSQLGEVRALPGIVGYSAVKAEQERSWNEGGRNALFPDSAIWFHRQGFGHTVPAMPDDPALFINLLDPVGGQAIQNR